MKNSKAFIIMKKELFRVFGDKKMIMSLYIMPAIIVIIVYGLMGKMIGAMESDIEEHVATVTVVNGTDDLKAIMDSSGYKETADVTFLTEDEYRAQKDELENGILEGDNDLVIYLDPDFESKVKDYENGSAVPELDVFYNGTEEYSSQAYYNFSSAVEAGYQSKLLADRFGNLGYLTAFTENVKEIYKEEKANTQFMSMMLPYLIVMMLFAGVMSIGVDAIAGEKERGTLSSMLITPAKRRDIVLGKLVSMAILASISAVVYCIAMVIAIPLMGMDSAGLSSGGFGAVSFGFVQIIELFLNMLVLVYLYVGIVGLLAVLAKDTKAASSMISPVYIVVILFGIMTMFSFGREIPFYRYMIPIYGNALAIKDLVSNELQFINFISSIAGTLVLGIAFTVAITRAFESEKIMFNA